MRIMIVDDDPGNLKILKRVLSYDKSFLIESFESPVAALERLRKEDFDLILSDYRMPKMDGISFFAKSKQIQPLATRIMVTAYCDKELLYSAINTAHIQHYIEKPYDPESVRNIVNEALKDRREELRLSHLNQMNNRAP